MKKQAQEVRKLIERAAECNRYGDSNSALHFSQAAVNCTNAMINLASLQHQFPEIVDSDSTESSNSGDVA